MDKENQKEKPKDREADNCCCYYVDPCGCHMVDPCGCYMVNPCCC
ncbi:hypothetical protein ACFL9T_13960 [Thermodesulfobacteriota bacterium]